MASDGAIFISMNFADESAYLRCIYDEIFGKNNFIGELTWESTTQPIISGVAIFNLQQKTEPIYLYAKNKKEKQQFILQELESNLKYPHQGVLGDCRFEIIEKLDSGDYSRPTMKFEILGQLPRKGKRWQIGKDVADYLLKNKRLEIVDGIVKKAIYPEDEIDKRKFLPFWSHFSASQVGSALNGKEILNTIMTEPIGFDTVKPPKLIEELISHIDPNAIILDSFAGSDTTAHAVLNMNKQDGGNRQFILVEMEDYAEGITAERIKRVIKGYGDTEGLDGNFSFYDLGEQLLIDNQYLNEKISIDRIREYIFFMETKAVLSNSSSDTYYLDVHNNTGYYFYYKKGSVTTLNYEFLKQISNHAENYVVYADICTLCEEELLKYHITFKKIPRDIARL